MKRPVKLEIASLKALGAFVILGTVAHAAMPYLPLIGPPPLRVQAVKGPAPAVVKFQATPAELATNSTVIAETKDTPLGTNIMAILTGANFDVVTPDQSLGDNFTASVFAMPTPDLLGITPQMLAAYFHPIQMGTNSLPVTGPFRVTFMPPLPPDNSSHAQYILK
jgi:hypothetical protein